MTRRSCLLLSIVVVLLHSSCGVFSAAQPLAFRTLDQSSSIRSPDLMLRDPALYVVATPQEIDAFARDVLGIDPQAPGDDQRGRLIAQLHTLDYQQEFAVLTTAGLGHLEMTVDGITKQNTQLTITAAIRTVQPGEGQTGDVREPYHTIAIKKAGATWGQVLEIEMVVRGGLLGGKTMARISHRIP
jgi:hypothetical protein